MGKIKDIPINERPRERALRLGVKTLSNQELLAIIIGNGTLNNSALEIAFNLISENRSLENLSRCSFRELLKCKGIGKISAIKLSAIFELISRIENERKNQTLNDSLITPEFIYERYKEELQNESQERLMVIGVDSRKKLIFEKNIFIGGESEMPASTKPILALVLGYNCKNFYIMHNHPHYRSAHSDRDVVFFEQLRYEAKKLNLKVIASIVIGEDGFSLVD